MARQFRSFEETLALIGALVVAGVAYKFFHSNLLWSAIAGSIAAVVIAYITFFEFTLQGDTIIYRNRFRQQTLPITWVQKAGVKNFWSGLPGKTYMFILKTPPAPWNGYWARTGMLTWPVSAERWIEAVNAAVEKADASHPTKPE